MFESLQTMPADAILGLITEHRDDPRPEKIDLGVGVYRNAAGETPILSSVKKAEHRLLETQASKAYIGTAGDPTFNAAMQQLTFADSVADERLVTIQAPGGSGSLRVAAGMLLRARDAVTVWVGQPTWANHVPLLGGAGLELKPYPYYDSQRHVIQVDAMLDALRAVSKGDVILLHGCCHNPSGLDPTEDEWRAIFDVIVDRELLPFVDVAYQGFARGVEEDSFVIRELASRVPEMIVANSCSKNFGLYRDRVGSLSFLAADAASRDVVSSQVNNFVRTIYSMPPDHGGAVVSMILNDKALRAEWIDEVNKMRGRLQGMRVLLNDALAEKTPEHDFSHLVRANGMFCFLGISAEHVQALKKNYGIYMVESSRINVAGITEENVGYLSDSIAAVLGGV
jgi:aspartate/tyrosine/aromatic aminotransferase